MSQQYQKISAPLPKGRVGGSAPAPIPAAHPIRSSPGTIPSPRGDLVGFLPLAPPSAPSSNTGAPLPSQYSASPRLATFLDQKLPEDIVDIQRWISNHIKYTLNRTRDTIDQFGLYQATAYSVRNRLTERWNSTHQYFTEAGVKQICYLSLEWLMGRALQNALLNLHLNDQYSEALRDLGFALEDLYDHECDAALGNGGLGRLAACFIDSMATLNYPCWGYGMRYTYGMFHQRIKDGFQVEFPEFWLTYGNPWEIERLDVQYLIQFGGNVTSSVDSATGLQKNKWENTEVVRACAYDTLIPGFSTQNTLTLRLWAAKPAKEFDLQMFSKGDFFTAVSDKQASENITSVLYPNDKTENGQILRLKQEYFFVSATIQDIIMRMKKAGRPMAELPRFVGVQLNDTHPALAIPELMRILIDEEAMTWAQAWSITNAVFAYTNHTILPEALEKWPIHFLERTLPRHLQIIYGINHFFLNDVVERAWPGDTGKMRSLSLIDEDGPRYARMANLAIVASHTINGVAALHTDILKGALFKDFHQLWPQKFQNKTNGVTPRRWINQANPSLTRLITASLVRGDAWLKDLNMLRELEVHASHPEFLRQWAQAKFQNKERFAQWIKANMQIEVDPLALFDVHVKRIHEYKRQLLNILSCIHRYIELQKMSPEQRAACVPRVVIFGGKAAVGYDTAKRIIKLINAVAAVVNDDPACNKLLKVIFVPNYCVSLAEIIIPAADLSQQISTAGMEASGTGNMKFAMNGSLIIGTMDGANIEICEEIGEENMFVFGIRTPDVPAARQAQHAPGYKIPESLQAAIESIQEGLFGDPHFFAPLVDPILTGKGRDYYLIAQDWPLYLECQERVERTFKNKALWTRMSILSTARMAKFSSDRSITEYANEIWNIQPCATEFRPRTGPSTTFFGPTSF